MREKEKHNKILFYFLFCFTPEHSSFSTSVFSCMGFRFLFFKKKKKTFFLKKKKKKQKEQKKKKKKRNK